MSAGTRGASGLVREADHAEGTGRGAGLIAEKGRTEAGSADPLATAAGHGQILAVEGESGARNGAVTEGTH